MRSRWGGFFGRGRRSWAIIGGGMGMRCRRESFRRIWTVSIARGLVRGMCEGGCPGGKALV